VTTSPLSRLPEPDDRRRIERRTNARLSDLTVPELRRIAITTTLFAVVLGLFLWMVRDVLIAAILGVVMAAYLRPLYSWLARHVRHRSPAALITLALVLVPVIAALAYSYLELVDVLRYVSVHKEDVAAQIDAALHRLPFMQGADTLATVRRWVLQVSNYGASIPGELREGLARFSVAGTIFLFTAWYVFIDAETIVRYLRSKVPPRYTELVGTLETNVGGVLYGAVYATLLTQAIKSGVILAMNLVFGVPLAVVLAIISFIIGFFPIIGSWSVYVPVAAWLLVFRQNAVGAGLMILVGFLLNTLFISMYVRPKMAAERSRVLNFYWMFIGLVTGVYTFGLAGILLGPILIGLLKAVVDTVTERGSWRLLELPDDDDLLLENAGSPGNGGTSA
jgi:predicted PurR-regulated permease PerM